MSPSDKTRTPDGEPHAIDLLAPWSAVDKLDEADLAALERMLGEDPELARRLEIAAEERDETVAVNEALPTPSRASMDRLFERIAADEAARAPKTAGIMGWLSSKLSLASPGQLAWGATAAAVVIALQASLLTGAYLGDDERSYQTASAPEASAPAAQDTAPAPAAAPAPAPASPDAAVRRSLAQPSLARARRATILVAFEPAATAAAITAALTEAKVEIVSGPKPGGMFVAGVLEGQPQDAIALLKAKAGVVKLVAPGDAQP